VLIPGWYAFTVDEGAAGSKPVHIAFWPIGLMVRSSPCHGEIQAGSIPVWVAGCTKPTFKSLVPVVCQGRNKINMALELVWS
jgi:hypothetical protein